MQGLEIFRAFNAKLGYVRAPALPPPATPEQVAAIEAEIGYKLPPTLVAMYLAHDGEVKSHGHSSPGYFFNCAFYRLDEIATNINGYFGGVDAEEYRGRIGCPYLSFPPGCIRERYYMRGWVPFAGTYAPEHFAIDYVPEAQGSAGQIIYVDADSQERYVLAPDFDSFLGMVMRAYDERKLHRRFGWRSNESLDILKWRDESGTR